jgi:hypothetical protein
VFKHVVKTDLRTLKVVQVELALRHAKVRLVILLVVFQSLLEVLIGRLEVAFLVVRLPENEAEIRL